MKTFIFDISLERLWYGCYDLKKQKQYAADETDLDDCISQDGNISDAPMFAVTLRKLMRQNGTPFVGENAIVLFHTSYGSTKFCDGGYDDEDDDTDDEVLHFKKRSERLVSSVAPENESSFETAHDIIRLLGMNCVFVADYGKEKTVFYSVEEATDRFGGYEIEKKESVFTTGTMVATVLILMGVVFGIIFAPKAVNYLKENGIEVSSGTTEATPEETVDIICTLSGINEVSSNNSYNNALTVNHYLYLTDSKGVTLQWEVSPDTYALIDYRYEIGDTITVTKHPDDPFYPYKIGDMNLLRSMEVPE